MQLHLIFQKKLNKLKVGKFQSSILSNFLAVKRTVARLEGGGRSFLLFLWLILSVHINF